MVDSFGATSDICGVRTVSAVAKPSRLRAKRDDPEQGLQAPTAGVWLACAAALDAPDSAATLGLVTGP